MSYFINSIFFKLKHVRNFKWEFFILITRQLDNIIQRHSVLPWGYSLLGMTQRFKFEGF